MTDDDRYDMNLERLNRDGKWMNEPMDVLHRPVEKSTMFCFRAHRPTTVLLTNYERFVAAYGNERVCILVDQTNGSTTWPEHVNTLKLDNKFLDDLNLYYAFQKVGWRCGDYFYYLALQNFDFDYLWLIESDVYFDYEKLADFFDPFETMDSDFVSHRVRRREPEWYWYRSMSDLGYREVYGSLFPLTRISRPALHHLLTERQRLSDIFAAPSAEQLFPNDEAFTASTLLNTQFSMQSLTETHPEAFPFFQYADKYCLPDILAAAPQSKVIHSALEPSQYAQYAQSRFLKKLRSDANLVKTVKVLYQHTDKERHPDITAALMETMQSFIEAAR